MTDDKKPDPAQYLPPWALPLLLVLGAGGVGGLTGGGLGTYATTQDLARVESKVDAVTEVVTEIRVTLARRDR